MKHKIENGTDLIASLQDGDLADSVYEAHQEAMQRILDLERATGNAKGKAKVIITIEYDLVHNQNGTVVNMDGHVDSKIPRIPAVSSRFLHPDGTMSQTPPGQEEIEFETPTRETSANVTTINRD